MHAVLACAIGFCVLLHTGHQIDMCLHSSIPAVQARADEDAGEGEEAAEVEADGEAAEASGSGLPWDGSDRDYHYEELLGKLRLFCMQLVCFSGMRSSAVRMMGLVFWLAALLHCTSLLRLGTVLLIHSASTVCIVSVCLRAEWLTDHLCL